jgi:hypothetical protein
MAKKPAKGKGKVKAPAKKTVKAKGKKKATAAQDG